MGLAKSSRRARGLGDTVPHGDRMRVCQGLTGLVAFRNSVLKGDTILWEAFCLGLSASERLCRP